MIPAPPRELVDLAATLAALALLVLGERHRAEEERALFAGAAAERFGFADSWPVGIRIRSRGAGLVESQIFETHRWFEVGIPLAAFSVVLTGLAAGFLGHPWGFALAASFAIADKLLSHELLDLPGDTGWLGTVAAAALLALRFDLWGAVAGAGLLAGFLGGLWALGTVRGWGRG